MAIAICMVLFALTIYLVQRAFNIPEAGVAHTPDVQNGVTNEKHIDTNTQVAIAKKK